MSLGTSNRDGGKTSESGHLRALAKIVTGDIITGLNVVQRAAGVNMSVDIQVGDAFVRRSDGTYAHPVFNDAVYNQVISAADGSNPRRDIVVIYVDYGQAPSTAVSNNTNGVVKIKVVNGTPAGSPVDPNAAAIQASVGAGNPYSILARVRVPAGQTSISNSLIDDLRIMITSNATVTLPKINGGSTAGMLTTDASGNVTSSSFVPSNQYKFSAYRSAALNSAAIDTVIAFDTELFDTNNNFDVTTNKGRYTVPVTGYYWFNALAGNTAATSTAMRCGLMINGVLKKIGNMAVPTNANNRFGVSGVLYLTAGQYVEATYLGGGGSVMATGPAECYFEGFLVSAL